MGAHTTNVVHAVSASDMAGCRRMKKIDTLYSTGITIAWLSYDSYSILCSFIVRDCSFWLAVCICSYCHTLFPKYCKAGTPRTSRSTRGPSTTSNCLHPTAQLLGLLMVYTFQLYNVGLRLQQKLSNSFTAAGESSANPPMFFKAPHRLSWTAYCIECDVV